jgi:hypothetical protein
MALTRTEAEVAPYDVPFVRRGATVEAAKAVCVPSTTLRSAGLRYLPQTCYGEEKSVQLQRRKHESSEERGLAVLYRTSSPT